MIVTKRYQPRLQVLMLRLGGWKYTQRGQLVYKSAQADAPALRLRLANHYNFPEADFVPPATGRIGLSVEDAYWQGNKLRIKEVLNGNPLGLAGFDSTLDVGFNNVHGYKCESLPAGAWRDFEIIVNGVGLTFTTARYLIEFLYPHPA
jgi:hypothetical protein